MPFRPVSEFPRDPQPLVRVFFTGQMIVKPTPSGDKCEVFIHRNALDHELSIEVRLKRPGKPDSVMMRHMGPLEFARPEPPNPVAEHGLFIIAAAPAGIRRYNGVDTTEGKRLGLALDLKNFHPGKTKVSKAAGQPSILMNDAIFYSAEETHPELIVELQKNGVTIKTLTPFTTVIGANIYSDLVTVEWREKGRLETLKLVRPAPNASFEIYIINDPLCEGPPRPGLPAHDELKEYYNALPEVPHPDRFNLFFTAVPREAEAVGAAKGSTRNPCMSLIDDGA